MGFMRSKVGYGHQGWLIMFGVVVATASMLAVSSMAKSFVVGGSEGWHYGFNYGEWLLQNGPFYLNDTLVFKYDAPTNKTFPHNVILLGNFQSYQACNVTGAKVVGNVTEGGGEGLKFVISEFKPYYFACGIGNGSHCKEGTMKFLLIPLPWSRPNNTHAG